MNESVVALLGVVLAALISLAGVIYVQRSTRDLRETERLSVHDAEKQKLEAEAYTRARESYEAAISRYQEDLGRLQGRLEAVERRAQHAEDRAAVAEARAREAETQAAVFMMLLRKHNIPIPEVDHP